jgi:hypothetical protein
MLKGQYPNMSHSEYHSFEEYLSATSLKKFIRSNYSMAHMKTLKDSAASRALVIGSALHVDVLEPWEKAVHFSEFKTAASKGFKAQADALPDDHYLLTATEAVNHEGMKQSLRDHDYACKILSNCDAVRECAVFSQYKGQGIKTKFDLYDPADRILWDIKTSRSAHVNHFTDDLFALKYDVQLAMYAMILTNEGLPVEKAGFIVVEKEPPWAVNVIILKPEVILRAQEVVRDALDKIAVNYNDPNPTTGWPPFVEVGLPYSQIIGEF